jgi:hypothetical protein
MKYIALTILLSLIWLKLPAQDCDCLSQFLYVKNYIESNNPAFQTIKNNYEDFQNYQKQVRILTDLTRNEKSIDRCAIYLEDYFLLLKDNHSGIRPNITRLPIDFSSQSSIDDYKLTDIYRSFEKVSIDTSAFIARLKSRPVNDIEGIYTNGRGLYFGIEKSKENYYKGVVLRKTSLLDIGHVLMDIEKVDDETFAFTLHYGLLAFNFQNIFMKIKPEGGRIKELGFSKSGMEAAEDIKPYELRLLDSVTNYLRISSFDKSLKQELELFYQSIDSVIQRKPYLILDLRDNGGGDEECYTDLLKYFCTKPFEIDPSYVWISPDNIRKYESEGHPQELIERMKIATPFTFIPLIQNAITSWEIAGTRYPEKIALIFNRKTASSAEGLIMYATQSDKVITLGENSGGYLGYGNVKNELIPCGKYIINSTTTRYSEKSKFEFVGITPEITLNKNQDWVKSAITTLKQP